MEQTDRCIWKDKTTIFNVFLRRFTIEFSNSFVPRRVVEIGCRYGIGYPFAAAGILANKKALAFARPPNCSPSALRPQADDGFL